VEADGGDVDAIDCDVTARELDETEEGGHDGSLSRPGSADNADALTTPDVHAEALEHEGQIRPVAHLDIVEDNLSLLRPQLAHVDGMQRCFLLELRAVESQALHRVHAVLDFRQLPDRELDHLDNGENVTQHQPPDGRRDAEPRSYH
jgi:hypothetical protein